MIKPSPSNSFDDKGSIPPHAFDRKWPTPRVLRASLLLGWAAVLLFFLALHLNVTTHRAAIKTVGLDSAPSIIAAQQMKAALANMDANAANQLISPPGQDLASYKDYLASRKEFTDNLILAAENITYGDAERIPLKTMENELGGYERAIERARTLHERSDTAGAIQAYRVAYLTLRTKLLPAADALDKANDDALNQDYSEQKSNNLFYTVFLWFAGLLLLGVLLATQLYLSRRMRRTLNSGLLLATSLTVVLLILSNSHFQQATHHLKVAKEDAFDSVRYLWRTRSLAYDANADESRWFVDADHSQEYQNGFFTKTALIAKLPAGQSYEEVASKGSKGQIPGGFTGYLADELGNITFAGEREAAVQTLSDFGRYMQIDGRIRSLEKSGNHQAAVALCIGNEPNQSNWAYNRFDRSLGQTLDINQKEFEIAIQSGFSDIDRMNLSIPVGSLLIALFILAGLWKRLKEYSF